MINDPLSEKAVKIINIILLIGLLLLLAFLIYNAINYTSL